MMIRRPLKFLCLLTLIVAGLGMTGARAQGFSDLNIKDDEPVIVELFTSSNCSACMEADRILYDLSKNKNIITLGCHIDYWDEATLQDPTGLEACTYRQWTYKASGMMSATEVTVPHFVVNGRQSIQKNNIAHFMTYFSAAIDFGLHKPLNVGMKWKDQKNIYITLPETKWKLDKKDSYSVWLVRYQDSLVKRMDEGQTAGRILRFTNVVQASKHIAKWHGEKRTIEVEVDTPKGGPDRGGFVVLIHEVNGSDIIAAGKLPDFKIKKKRPGINTLEQTPPSEESESVDKTKPEETTPSQ